MSRTEIQIVKDGYIVTNDLANDCVTTAKIDDLAVTTGKIKNQAVTASKLASDISFFPVGGIVMWSGSEASIPTGWALCNGQNNTPDLRGRFIVAAGSGSGYNVGDSGGANTVTLTTNQIPAHNHTTGSAGGHGHTASGSSGSGGGHGHTAQASSGGNHRHNTGTNYAGNGGDNIAFGQGYDADQNPQTSTNGNHSHTITIGNAAAHSHPLSVTIGNVGDHTHTVNNTGGGNAHENRPAYYALCFIMKTT